MKFTVSLLCLCDDICAWSSLRLYYDCTTTRLHESHCLFNMAVRPHVYMKLTVSLTMTVRPHIYTKFTVSLLCLYDDISAWSSLCLYYDCTTTCLHEDNCVFTMTVRPHIYTKFTVSLQWLYGHISTRSSLCLYYDCTTTYLRDVHCVFDVTVPPHTYVKFLLMFTLWKIILEHSMYENLIKSGLK